MPKVTATRTSKPTSFPMSRVWTRAKVPARVRRYRGVKENTPGHSAPLARFPLLDPSARHPLATEKGTERVREMLRGQEKNLRARFCRLFSSEWKNSQGQAQQDDRTAAVLRYLPS